MCFCLSLNWASVKIQDDLERVEIRSHNLQCYKLEIEHEQMRTQFSIDNKQLMITQKMENEQLMITHKMENKQKKIDNRMSTVNTFATTMDMLDPLW